MRRVNHCDVIAVTAPPTHYRFDCLRKYFYVFFVQLTRDGEVVEGLGAGSLDDIETSERSTCLAAEALPDFEGFELGHQWKEKPRAMVSGSQIKRTLFS